MTAFGLILATLLFWPAPTGTSQERPVFVTASFLGKNRLFLEDVNINEVRVFEDNQPRKVELFERDQIPTVYGLVFERALFPETFGDPRQDPSAKLGSSAASNIAYQLVDQVLARDTGFVGVYDESELSIDLSFTQDSGRIKDAVDRIRGRHSMQPASLYTAIFSAVHLMKERHENRRVLILFLGSVDFDTAGKLKPLKNLLSGTNVELFIVGCTSRSGSGRGLPPSQTEATLRDLANTTAGDTFFTYIDGIESLGRRIGNQIRTFYTIGFQSQPSSSGPDKLRVECSRPDVKVKTHPVVPFLE